MAARPRERATKAEHGAGSGAAGPRGGAALDIGAAEFGNAIEEAILMFFGSQTRELLRTRPNPLTWEQARARRGARPAGRPPRPSAEPVTVQRRAGNTGVIMVAGRKIALGRIYCAQIVTVRPRRRHHPLPST